MPKGMWDRPRPWTDWLLQDAGAAISGKSGTSFLGGTMYFRDERIRCCLFFRMYTALCVLPES